VGKKGGGLLSRLSRWSDAAPLALRVAVGLVLASHGWDKVSGGMAAHVHTVTRTLHLHWSLAYLSAYAELAGGVLLLLGLFTRWAALAAAVILGTAMFRVHWSYGLRGPGGFELPLALLGGAVALVFLGAGRLSLDRGVLKREW
jgi:putative oxidoreductase